VRRVLLALLVALGHPRRYRQHGCWSEAMRTSENTPSCTRRNRSKDHAAFWPSLGKGMF
jgi:hypothetical protein